MVIKYNVKIVSLKFGQKIAGTLYYSSTAVYMNSDTGSNASETHSSWIVTGAPSARVASILTSRCFKTTAVIALRGCRSTFRRRLDGGVGQGRWNTGVTGGGWWTDSTGR